MEEAGFSGAFATLCYGNQRNKNGAGGSLPRWWFYASISPPLETFPSRARWPPPMPTATGGMPRAVPIQPGLSFRPLWESLQPLFRALIHAESRRSVALWLLSNQAFALLRQP